MLEVILEGVVIGLIILSAVGFSGFLIYRYQNHRHLERMKYIESGGDLSDIEDDRNAGSWALKFGVIFCGVAVGVLVGFLIELNIPSMQNPVPYIFSIFLFTGISFFVYYLLQSKYDN